MHRWGDTSVDWQGINDAAQYIGRRLAFWRIQVTQVKEKFGTVRVYCMLGMPCGFYFFFHPRDCYHRWPKHMKDLDYKYGATLCQWLNPLVMPLHKIVYRSTYKRAVKKWPHLRSEILDCADWPEYLKGI